MKKKKKRKIRPALLLILIILVAGLIYTISNNKESKADDTNISGLENNKSDNQNESKGDNSQIRVYPESYTAHSGEKILKNIFDVKIIKSGKEQSVKDDIDITSDSKLLEVQNDDILVSSDAVTSDAETITVSCNGFSKDVEIKIINTLDDNIDENEMVTNPAAYDMVVNKSRNLPDTYVPNDLVSLDDIPTVFNNSEINQLRKSAYEALKNLFKAAKEENSYNLYARSGYRSYNTQVGLYNAYVSKHGKEAADKFSAQPGQSEHQSGLAIDITSDTMNSQLSDTFGDTDEGIWVSENAHKYGFIIRYPKGKEDVTGYQYEPWHLRYVGKNLAGEVYDSGLTLEEYFEKISD